MTVVVPMEAGEEVIQEKVHDFVPFLCVDDSMVVSPWMERFRIYFSFAIVYGYTY